MAVYVNGCAECGERAMENFQLRQEAGKREHLLMSLDEAIKAAYTDAKQHAARMKSLIIENKRLRASLEAAGFTDEGGEFWKPPLGKRPDFEKIDSLEQEVENLKRELKYKEESFNVICAVFERELANCLQERDAARESRINVGDQHEALAAKVEELNKIIDCYKYINRW